MIQVENQEPTKISVRIGSKVNLGDYNSLEVNFQVDDRVRETDKSTAAAIDRVFGLVEAKLVEKLKPYTNLAGSDNE